MSSRRAEFRHRLPNIAQPFTFGANYPCRLVLFLHPAQRAAASRHCALRRKRAAHADPLTQSIQVIHIKADPWKKKSKSGAHLQRKPWHFRSPDKRRHLYSALTQMVRWRQLHRSHCLSRKSSFGTDPVQCTQILDDPSISSVHVRLQMDDGGYLLQDNNLIAGTWVNL